MDPTEMDIQTIEKLIADNGTRTVIVAGTDPAGVLRGKRLTVPYFRKAVESGVSFSSYILGTTTMDEVLPGLFDTGIPDVHGRIDLSTFRIAPWEDAAAIAIIDWVTPEGDPHPLCPRAALKAQTAMAAEMGFRAYASLELEFYLLPVPIAEVRLGRWADLPLPSKDIHCYSILEGHFSEPIIGRLRDCFPEEIEACLPEWGQGQFEVNLYRSDPLKMADTAVMMKLAVKQIASEAGATATFIAKLREDLSGSSGHIHLSLRDAETDASVFHDPEKPLRLSETFEQFVAGNMVVFREAALFYAPNVNSYKRMQSGSFAGTTCCWGVDNRTAGFRAINESPGKARLEIRVGGADLNPYLAIATGLGAGLRGIRERLVPPPASNGNNYEQEVECIPGSLAEAVSATEAGEAIREVMPPELVENALRIARFELEVFRATVTDLERRRYMETV
ncbi:glutamine synthetase family protein [Hoeflea sp.]|uniref:glutamine synthetase family protein n=1 Tax=Hoeflea sp. TaxID=1940281 RepID=UPI003B52731C